MITVDQLKDKSIVLSILPAMGCKSGLVGEISDKISDFKAWYRRDVAIAQTMAEEEAVGGLASLGAYTNTQEAEKPDDDGFFDGA
jgi:hypothetical protein